MQTSGLQKYLSDYNRALARYISLKYYKRIDGSRSAEQRMLCAATKILQNTRQKTSKTVRDHRFSERSALGVEFTFVYFIHIFIPFPFNKISADRRAMCLSLMFDV
jgi:hypothetical protein